MSILARYDSTCPHCHETISGGVHRVERLGRDWMHASCREAIQANRLEKYEVIQIPKT